MSCWIESMYSCSSLTGLVSSKRRWQRPPNSCAIPKLSAIAFGCPMCRYPFGSGGKRVTTSEILPSRTSAATTSRMKSLRSGVAALTGLLLIHEARPNGRASSSPEMALGRLLPQRLRLRVRDTREQSVSNRRDELRRGTDVRRLLVVVRKADQLRLGPA